MENKSNCPKCNTPGQVTRSKRNLINMECPECKETWVTESGMCPMCLKPNTFPTDGICGACYKELKEAGEYRFKKGA